MGKVLNTRLITSAIFAAVMLSSWYVGGMAWWLLSAVVVIIGCDEIIRLADLKRLDVAWWIAELAGMGFLLSQADTFSPFSVLLAGLFAALLLPVALENRVSVIQMAWALFGALYVGLLMRYGVALREEEDGRFWVLLTLLTTWAADSAAYLGGSLLKGPKLWPRVSPGKTITGAVTGAIGAVIVAMAFAAWLRPALPLATVALWGVLIFVAGLLGDLSESAVKRVWGKKDAGRLLPGHGGVLDRFDSLLFAFPAAYYLLEVGLL
ncbi:MAG: phosphatidate cytidylyltransferase [Firmicutes bacterium]|nr:phosphatidate cytidylyltransferase [Bacillota bacterium]